MPGSLRRRFHTSPIAAVLKTTAFDSALREPARAPCTPRTSPASSSPLAPSAPRASRARPPHAEVQLRINPVIFPPRKPSVRRFSVRPIQDSVSFESRSRTTFSLYPPGEVPRRKNDSPRDLRRFQYSQNAIDGLKICLEIREFGGHARSVTLCLRLLTLSLAPKGLVMVRNGSVGPGHTQRHGKANSFALRGSPAC